MSDGRDALSLDSTMDLTACRHPVQRIVVNHSSTPRTELFLARASTVKTGSNVSFNSIGA